MLVPARFVYITASGCWLPALDYFFGAKIRCADLPASRVCCASDWLEGVIELAEFRFLLTKIVSARIPPSALPVVWRLAFG